jgi:hypothetical protein
MATPPAILKIMNTLNEVASAVPIDVMMNKIEVRIRLFFLPSLSAVTPDGIVLTRHPMITELTAQP